MDRGLEDVKMTCMQWEKELAFARSVSMHAGDLALGYSTQGLRPDRKPDLSPVTLADKECEKLIAARIEEAFPNDGILGEEGSFKEARNGRKWILDPIDGTRDFVRGLPLWANLIALEADGQTVLGVVNLPPRREMYWGVRGQGAFCNDQRIRISSITSPSEALVCLNGINHYTKHSFGPRFLDWAKQFWAIRSMGGAYDAMLLASGHAELWIEPQPQAWDLAPLQVILEEAGARMINFDGGTSIYGGNAVGYVPALEPVVRDLLGL